MGNWADTVFSMTYNEVGLVRCLTLSWGVVFRLGAFRGPRVIGRLRPAIGRAR